MAGKLFGTDGVRGVANVFPMTAEFAFRLALSLSSLAAVQKNASLSVKIPESQVIC